MTARIPRRALLLAAFGSVVAACGAGEDDVAQTLSPLPAEPDGPSR